MSAVLCAPCLNPEKNESLRTLISVVKMSTDAHLVSNEGGPFVSVDAISRKANLTSAKPMQCLLHAEHDEMGCYALLS